MIGPQPAVRAHAVVDRLNNDLIPKWGVYVWGAEPHDKENRHYEIVTFDEEDAAKQGIGRFCAEMRFKDQTGLGVV